MNKHTQLISIERDEVDADCVLVNVKLRLGMQDSADSAVLASQNRMAGEKMFRWLSERVPPSVFDGFMAAARRDMDSAKRPSEVRAASAKGPTASKN
jgi:hypothetical protein